MLHTLKNYFLIFFSLFCSLYASAEVNPYLFIDINSQKMVSVLQNNSELFKSDRNKYENKIKEIFEPMIDFKRISASVMGKKYYLLATKEQKYDFINIFRDSLLNTYSETLAQWGDSSISTIILDYDESQDIKNIEVKQILDTGSNKYPISYKLRKNDEDWKIINIIINGVNLGLTFRNQFQALAISHNDNIELTLQNWVSDAGDAGVS